MALDRYVEEDFAKMKLIERTIIDAILPLVQNINPTLALCALIRCARVMLRKGDEPAQRALLPVIKAYLEGKGQPPDVREHPLLWLPPSERKH